jgi:hypothetical protein
MVPYAQQICKNSLVLDAYGCHSDAEFSRTLEDNRTVGSDELTYQRQRQGRSKPEISRHLQNPVYTDVAERTLTQHHQNYCEKKMETLKPM